MGKKSIRLGEREIGLRFDESKVVNDKFYEEY